MHRVYIQLRRTTSNLSSLFASADRATYLSIASTGRPRLISAEHHFKACISQQKLHSKLSSSHSSRMTPSSENIKGQSGADESQHSCHEEAETDARSPETSTSLPKCFLIVHSVSKRQNIGNLLRSATAFGVSEVCIIGSRKFSTFGSQGASNYVPVRSFATLAECCKHYREQEGCEIVGVEIMDGAKLIETHPFKGSTAFILGNEGSGLSESQTKHCDSFVYISQYGPGTASLNVYVAASIVLHHFALWANYTERSRTGGKFDLGEKPLRTAPRGMALLTWEEMKAEQDRRRLKREAAMINEEPVFGSKEGEAQGGESCDF